MKHTLHTHKNYKTCNPRPKSNYAILLVPFSKIQSFKKQKNSNLFFLAYRCHFLTVFKLDNSFSLSYSKVV